MTAATVLLGVAWVTDHFDGRFACSADRPTRLRAWDLRSDAWLCVCLVVGLAAGGYINGSVAVALAATTLIGFVLYTNPVPLALTTGAIFGLAVWELTIHGERLRWLPITYVAVATVASRHRVFRVNIPAVWAALRTPTAKRGFVFDDWMD